MPRSRVFRYIDGEVKEVKKTATAHRPRYPLPVETLAVHPDQIGEARDFDRQHGVPTDYRDDGTPIVQDAGHYKRYRTLHGYHFTNGYES